MPNPSVQHQLVQMGHRRALRNHQLQLKRDLQEARDLSTQCQKHRLVQMDLKGVHWCHCLQLKEVKKDLLKQGEAQMTDLFAQV
jgi:hypothetical protein